MLPGHPRTWRRLPVFLLEVKCLRCFAEDQGQGLLVKAVDPFDGTAGIRVSPQLVQVLQEGLAIFQATHLGSEVHVFTGGSIRRKRPMRLAQPGRAGDGIDFTIETNLSHLDVGWHTRVRMIGAANTGRDGS